MLSLIKQNKQKIDGFIEELPDGHLPSQLCLIFKVEEGV